MAILSVAARSLVVVAVRAAGVDLLGVDQAGVEQNADRLGSVEFAGESVQAGQQSVGEAGLDRAADLWAAGPALWLDRAEALLDCGIVARWRANLYAPTVTRLYRNVSTS